MNLKRKEPKVIMGPLKVLGDGNGVTSFCEFVDQHSDFGDIDLPAEGTNLLTFFLETHTPRRENLLLNSHSYFQLLLYS